MTVKELLQENYAKLPALEVDLLIAHALSISLPQLRTHDEAPVVPADLERCYKLILRRINGEPIAYIVGGKEFYGRHFIVTPAVLIPRPDSEVLIEAATTFLKDKSDLTIIDVGTGSGCLIITLALETDNRFSYIGLDISEAALIVAERNAQQYDVAVTFKKSNLLSALPATTSTEGALVVANLPYLSTEQMSEPSIQAEPALALHGGRDGLDYYRTLLQQLNYHGIQAAFLEINDFQAEELQKIIKKILPTWQIKFIRDFSGKKRLALLTAGRQN